MSKPMAVRLGRQRRQINAPGIAAKISSLRLQLVTVQRVPWAVTAVTDCQLAESPKNPNLQTACCVCRCSQCRTAVASLSDHDHGKLFLSKRAVGCGLKLVAASGLEPLTYGL